ncbi:hypothetical protein Taro_003813 [Colocasia esculenta]|uniref:Uncharacterized protein n=1 Tax=Colocasia esculenta TaxID=4460 RepID=A0A843TPV3_COLES|nr:hypothetical protein [Colocasia esculenta]
MAAAPSGSQSYSPITKREATNGASDDEHNGDEEGGFLKEAKKLIFLDEEDPSNDHSTGDDGRTSNGTETTAARTPGQVGTRTGI